MKTRKPRRRPLAARKPFADSQAFVNSHGDLRPGLGGCVYEADVSESVAPADERSAAEWRLAAAKKEALEAANRRIAELEAERARLLPPSPPQAERWEPWEDRIVEPFTRSIGFSGPVFR